MTDSSDDLDDALNDAADGADNADDSMKELNETAEKSEGSFSIAKGAVATFIGNSLTALAGAAVEAVGTIAELSDSTRNSVKTLRNFKLQPKPLNIPWSTLRYVQHYGRCHRCEYDGFQFYET